MRLAQSAASRRKRNVLITVGHPRLRITAFQVADGVLAIVAMGRSGTRVIRNCTGRHRDYQMKVRKVMI